MTIAYVLIVFAATTGRTLRIDTWAILALRPGQSPQLVPPMLVVSWIAGNGAFPIAVLIALLVGHLHGRRLAWLYALTCLSGWVLNVLLKQATLRARPTAISPHLAPAGYYSFPSGHVMLAVLIFGLGAVLLVRGVRSAPLRKATVAAAAAFTILVGVSRVYVGAHWPSDVVGGLVAGLGWATACVTFARHRGLTPV